VLGSHLEDLDYCDEGIVSGDSGDSGDSGEEVEEEEEQDGAGERREKGKTGEGEAKKSRGPD